MKNLSYALSLTFVAAVSFIFIFLAVGMVPYWQGMSGVAIQAWWSGPFMNFSTLMVPIHFLSILALGFGFFQHRKEAKPQKLWWIVALVGLLVCQSINFTLHGPRLNPALQSGSLADADALGIFDDWDFYHMIRTTFVGISLIALVVIGSVRR
ncbi:MAG: hypothetical protein AAGA85_25765 [Bacteroidota bacterium]